MPLRVPLAQPTTTGAVVGMSFRRLPRSPKGMLTVPGALAAANSPAERTSTSNAPRALSAGSMAATRREFHHL